MHCSVDQIRNTDATVGRCSLNPLGKIEAVAKDASTCFVDFSNMNTSSEANVKASTGISRWRQLLKPQGSGNRGRHTVKHSKRPVSCIVQHLALSSANHLFEQVERAFHRLKCSYLVADQRGG